MKTRPLQATLALVSGIMIASFTALTTLGELPPRMAQADDTSVRLKSGKTIFKALYAPMPVYPFKARLHYEGGRGLFRLVLRRDGTVSAIEVERTTGLKQLDVAAARALIQWRFPRPPEELTHVRVPVNFKMRNRISGGTILD